MGRFLLLAAFQLSLIPLIPDPPSLSPSASAAAQEPPSRTVHNSTDYDSLLLRPRLAPLSSPASSRNSDLVYFLPHLNPSPQSIMSLNTSSQYPILSKSRRVFSASLKVYRNVNYRRLVKFHSRWIIQRLSRGIRKLRLKLPCRIERAKALLTGRLSARCNPPLGLPSKTPVPPALTAALPPPSSPPRLPAPHPALPSTRTEYVHIPPAPVLYVPPAAQVEAHILAFRVLFTALVFIIPATLAMNRVSTKHVPGDDAPQPSKVGRISYRLRKSLFSRRKNLLSFVRGFAHSSKPRKRKSPSVQKRPRAIRSPRAFMYARPRAVPLATSPLLPLDDIQLAQPWSSLSVVSAYKPPAAIAQPSEAIHIPHLAISSERRRMRIRPYAARSPRAFKYARPARAVRSLALANLPFSKPNPSHLTTSSCKDPTPDAPHPTHYNEYLALTVHTSLLDVPPKEHTFDIQVNYMRTFHTRESIQVGQRIYRWQETLGKGSFGVVSLYKAASMHGEASLPDEIAVKQVAMEVDPEEGEEVAAMHRLEGNKWAVECLGRVHYRSEAHIMMRYYPSRSLHEYLLSQPEGKLPRDMALHYIAELITAVRELHKNGVMHRDIKPSNVFLSSNGHVVLGDFGIARAFPPPATSSTNSPLYPLRKSECTVASASGTVPFSAPEVMQRKMYSFGVDYYAVAVLGHVLLTGNLPFSGSVQAIKDDPGNVGLRSLTLGSGLTPDERDWFKAMLNHDPAKRIQSVEVIKRHAIFSEINWEAVAAQSDRVPHFHEDAFSASSYSESESESDDDDDESFHDSSPGYRAADLSSSDGESDGDEPFYDSSPLYHVVDL